ncbi:hypothetical protein DV706_18265 (plasmid) [Natronorubrum bangense]|uniref:Uncharacterized protein n=2 Tax=Natronorubrum bangense TaxID=61858 RepID=L9WHU2_9EURY|nr:hypothetical protein C494_09039 [Natronorubrum bangense JCM 10635]QCC56465.1 hypothetical protein DV706_18265 [Natronorubrum bangense]
MNVAIAGRNLSIEIDQPASGVFPVAISLIVDVDAVAMGHLQSGVSGGKSGKRLTLLTMIALTESLPRSGRLSPLEWLKQRWQTERG